MMTDDQIESRIAELERQIALESDVEHWRQQCQEVIAAVDPLNTDPVYVLTFDEVREAFCDFLGAERAAAFCGVSLTSICRDLLIERGEWRGFGPVMALCRLNSSSPAIALHELAHYLDDHAEHEIVRDAVKRIAEPVAKPPLNLAPMVNDGPDWQSHGSTWIRLALHLEHRAYYAGHVLNNRLVCNPEDYGFSSLSDYVRELDDEPFRLAYLPMVEVAQMTAPQRYRSFATQDLVRALEGGDEADLPMVGVATFVASEGRR